jgi:hypothetical protein
MIGYDLQILPVQKMARIAVKSFPVFLPPAPEK